MLLRRIRGQPGSVSLVHQEGTRSKVQRTVMYVRLEPLQTVRRLCATRAQKAQLGCASESVLRAHLAACRIRIAEAHHA